jgi:hypothetical protein
MGEPVPLRTMDADERQELKEAVCDAILERTRRVVSGEGDFGRVVLGDRPSRVLASGFILPRLNANGDDESSDIRVAAHGMDLRLRTMESGTVTVRPTFSVYVRALPSADELFDRNGRLVPPADFSRNAKKTLRDAIRVRMQQRPKEETKAERFAAREAAAREVMSELGVVVPTEARVIAVANEDDEDAQDPGARGQDIRLRMRIPSKVSRTYEVPQKWVRIGVDAPPLELKLPATRDQWEASARAHVPQLVGAARTACAAWISSPEGLAWAWRPGNVPSEAFWDRLSWEAFLTGLRQRPPDPVRIIPPLDVKILVDLALDPLEEGIASLRVALENLREQDDDLECGAYGVSIDVDVPDLALVPMRLERIRRSYHLAGFLSMPAVGVNCGVDDRGLDGGLRKLRTTWMPRYVLPSAVATVLEKVPTAYATLKDSELDVGALSILGDQLRLWISDVEKNTRLAWPGEGGTAEDEAGQQARFRDDLNAWRREASRVDRGAAILKRSQLAWRTEPGGAMAMPYRAWLLLNRTFAAANPRREGERDPGWRLFQLAFILAHVPTLTSRLPGHETDFDASFDEDSASLLYMATGGGKTEAFFGTIVFALFIDRLRGKRRGVTAMMHYPLRLLTIQQAQRLARLLAKAEVVRRQEKVAGAAFELGFWVGGANTPNRTEERAGKVSRELLGVPTWQATPVSEEGRLIDSSQGNKDYVAARDAWNKLPTCPFCSASTGLRLFPERHHRLGIVCTGGDGCAWNGEYRDRSEPEPLPFLLVDSDIYRRAPSVLLGTVDKLALLGQSTYTVNRIAGMFGLARLVEGGDDGLLDTPDQDVDDLPAGHERLAPSWLDGKELFHDPFPSLIVQDEMHLLDESLGTFGGVFETGLFAWFKEICGLLGSRCSRVPGAPDQPRLPHIIGATATAADAAKHVGALYQKRVVQFPHPGPALFGGFYVRRGDFTPGSSAYDDRTAPTEPNDVPPREKESAAPWARVYVSLMTNGRLHTVTTLAVLAAHAATITRWLRDLGSRDPVRQSRAGQEMTDSLSDARWKNRRLAALAREIAGSRYDRLASVVDLHRIELTYVTNKKGGDQILSAITGEVAEAHDAMGPGYSLAALRWN